MQWNLEAYYAFVKKLVDAFESSRLDYAFTGALAVSFYGVPRTTTDVDILIMIGDQAQLKDKITSALSKAGLIVNEQKILNAIVSGYKIVNLRDKTLPYSVDVIFSDVKVQKKPGKINGVNTFFQSPEGLIAAKLRMIKATMASERSIKDKEDIKAILAFTKVNVAEVKKQARQDNTLEIFKALNH